MTTRMDFERGLRNDLAVGEKAVRAATVIGAVALPLAIAEAVIIGVVVPEGGIWLLPFAAMFLSGLFAARRLPHDRAARRLLVLGAIGVVWIGCGDALAIAARNHGSGSWLVAPVTIQNGLDLALPAAILALFTVYPDGRYQRSYERLAVRLFAILAAAVPLLLLLARPTMHMPLSSGWLEPYAGPAPTISSPFHVGALGPLAGPLSGYASAAIPIAAGLATLLLVLRHRRFGAAGRLQIRWPLAALALAAMQPAGDALAAAGIFPQLAADLPIIAVLTLLGAAIAVGLLRPALFDLDRIFKRSLAYVALWAAIGAAYLGIAAAAGIAASGKGLQMAIGVTIAVTLLFQPAREALARRAARWAYGEQPSRAELLRSLGAALEQTLEPTHLPAALAATIREGLGAEWVRIDVSGLPPVIDGRAPRAAEEAAGSAPLAYGGRRIGALECGPAARGIDRDLLATLARQSALAMGNARLATELRARAEELAASRTRIVEAEERGRRRIERDIHDGVQQELVALIARIGLARHQLERDPGEIAATLDNLESETRQALADLRELAGGIHPSVLGDRGIVEAIEVRAARLPLGVTIESDRGLRESRFSAAVEGAAYFIACEGFANALKHSGAERVTVRLGLAGSELTIEIADNGCGFDPAARRGSGLDGLTDRTEALGGSFQVESAPGAGTTLRAHFKIQHQSAASSQGASAIGDPGKAGIRPGAAAIAISAPLAENQK